jgi:hypothetical protein
VPLGCRGGVAPARPPNDDDRIRLGQGLQTSGEVGRFTDDRLLLRRAQVADLVLCTTLNAATGLLRKVGYGA